MLINCICLDLKCTVHCYNVSILMYAWRLVFYLKRVVFAFLKVYSLGLVLRFWWQKTMLPINTQNKMWLEEEMLLSLLMFSTIQVNNTTIYSLLFSVLLCIGSIFVFGDAECVSSSSYFGLYFNYVTAFGCYPMLCLCNPAVGGGCCSYCGTTGIVGNCIYPVFAILWLFL